MKYFCSLEIRTKKSMGLQYQLMALPHNAQPSFYDSLLTDKFSSYQLVYLFLKAIYSSLFQTASNQRCIQKQNFERVDHNFDKFSKPFSNVSFHYHLKLQHHTKLKSTKNHLLPKKWWVLI